MATPAYGSFGLTGDVVLDGLTHGYRWNLSPDRTIDWSLSAGAGFGWNSVAQEVIASALSSFAYVANVRFHYTGYFHSPAASQAAGSEIDFGWANLGPTAAAQGLFPRPQGYGLYPGDSGDISLNYRLLGGATNIGIGSDVFRILVHEIGHVLGLKHPHDDGDTGRPLMSAVGLGAWDRDWATVMSYSDSHAITPARWNPATPMALDVIALQYLYGKNMATNAGDTVHTVGRIGFYGTYWDASGNDTVSASGQPEGWVISLPDFQPSTLVDTRVGLATPVTDRFAPYPTTLYWLTGDMENATGSSYADILQGNAFANNLLGGGGDDLIDGGGGVDTAWFSPGRYRIERSGEGVTVAGPDGTDTLLNVERIRIGELKYALDIDGAGGQVYRLYQAAFNRTPDPAGLGFQIGELDRGVSLQQVAGNFIASPEFQRTYGTLDNAAFASQLYANVLHRTPDAGGLAFHVGNLAGGMSRAQVLVGFSESPENQAALLGVTSSGMLYA